MLHISPEEQKARLLARLDDPTKYWKYNPGDLAERARWGEYRAAYEIALERNNTEQAPWHVIPADKKWYRNLAVGNLLLETLRRLDPQWPDGRLRRRGREAAAAGRGADHLDPGDRRRHAVRHAAARGRQPARDRRGRRPGHLRLQVPRRRPGYPGARGRGGRQRAGPAARAADAPPGRAGPGPGDRPVRGGRGGPGPAQRQPGPEPRRRLPAGRVRVRRRARTPRTTRWARASCGWTPSPRTSTAPGATPTCCAGTATSG